MLLYNFLFFWNSSSLSLFTSSGCWWCQCFPRLLSEGKALPQSMHSGPLWSSVDSSALATVSRSLSTWGPGGPGFLPFILSITSLIPWVGRLVIPRVARNLVHVGRTGVPTWHPLPVDGLVDSFSPYPTVATRRRPGCVTIDIYLLSLFNNCGDVISLILEASKEMLVVRHFTGHLCWMTIFLWFMSLACTSRSTLGSLPLLKDIGLICPSLSNPDS